MTPLGPDREAEIRALAANARSDSGFDTWWLWDEEPSRPYGPMLAFAHAATPETVADLLAALDGVRADHAHVREALTASTELLTRALLYLPESRRIRCEYDDRVIENQRVLKLTEPEAKP